MPDLDLSAGLIDTQPRKAKARLPELLDFLKENNLQPGSTTGGTHNRGSRHYSGNAVDIKGSGAMDLSRLNEAASARGFKLRDERTRPKRADGTYQKVWGGAHWHLEAVDGEQGMDLSAGLDNAPQKQSSTVDLSAGFEQRPSPSKPQHAASVQRAKPKPQQSQPSNPYDVNAILAAARGSSRYPTFDEDRRARTIALAPRNLRQVEDTEMSQRRRVEKDVAHYTPRIFESKNPADVVNERLSVEREQNDEATKHANWERANAAAIADQTAAYRADIQVAKQRGGDANKWLAEMGSKGATGLTELVGGIVKPVAPNLSNKLRVHVLAAQRAAEEEGADRNVVSRTVQNITAGFIASAPELAAMSSGLSAPVAFGAGSGARAYAGDRPAAPAIVHGAATGAAFDLPAAGSGIGKVLRKGRNVGAASTGIELAAGASPQQALTTGLTNAAMAAGPEAIRLRPRSKANAEPVSTRSELSDVPNIAERSNGTSAERVAADSAVTEQPHHSNLQSRRVRNTATGRAGQFKKGTVKAEDVVEWKPPQVKGGGQESVDERFALYRTASSAAPAPWVLERTDGPREHFRTKQKATARANEIASEPVEKGAPDAAVDNAADVEAKPSLSSTVEGGGKTPPSAITLRPRQQGQRSFPETVKRAGYEAESSTYDVLPNTPTVAKANAVIESKGVDAAVDSLTKRGEFTAEDVAVGSRAIQEYEKSGQMGKAIDTVETVAERLTSAGQTVQAASIIARLSPEGTLLYAQRQLPKGKKLSVEQGEKLVATSKRVVQHEAKIATLDERIAEIQAQASGQAKQRIGTLQDRLLKLETDARARLAARTGVGKGSQTGASTIPLDIADYAIIGAAKLARKGVTLASWSNEIVKEFGEEIRPRLKAIYRESYRTYDEQRKQFAAEREERGARKAQPDAKDVQEVINQRALARKDARTARTELRRLYNDLSLTRGGKAKAVAGDILNVPRTLKSSVDLSAPRQGAMWMVNHPVQGVKLFFGKQLRAMREVNYDRFVDQLESDPDYPLMVRSKLALATVDARPNSLSGREEAFMSRIAGKIPGVSHSERAYTTFLDTARSSWFKQLKGQAEAKAKAEGRALETKDYDAIANFVNIGTGRGNLGSGTVNKLSPFLNALFFAPKFAASKVQVFDPRVYARLPKGARLTAMREAATYFGAMTTTALLLKYGFNLSVGLNPEDSEFMKLRIGNTRYDISNGTGQYITLAARLLRNADNKRTGTADGFGKSIGQNIDRFTRYKYSPPAAATRNTWEGRNAIGEPTSASKEAVDLITPLFLKDLYDAYKEEGLTGVAKTAPAVVGVGVNTYDRDAPRAKPVKLKPAVGEKRKRGKLTF